jgi:Invasin, domain 3/CHU_C Type IX secretion signal domain
MVKVYLIILLLIVAGLLSAENHLIWITANPDTIFFDDNVTYSIIQAMVEDDDGNPVEGVRVDFSSDIGIIVGWANTGSNGIAEEEFGDSNDLGVATITAEYNGEYLEVQVTIIMPVSVEENEIISPISNLTNYPNPFNPSTTIEFSVNTDFTENTELMIFNSKGQKIKELSVILSGVEGSAIWNGTDNSNQPVSSGVYFYRIKAGDFEQTKKMMLMK